VSTPDVDNRSSDGLRPIDGTFESDLIAYITDNVALDDGEIVGSTDLLVTGLVDSLGIVLVVSWIEGELGISIDPADVVLEHFQTVDQMVEFLRGT
jgi:acyl carrier protein